MIEFFKLVDGGIPPMPASKSAQGRVPTDGYRYCEPLRAASSFGWYVYLPLDLWLHWDGSEIQWSLDEGEQWFPLASAIQYPGFSKAFDAAMPEACQGFAPPFITRGTEHNVVQIWTGVIAKTDPDIALLVRGPANMIWRNDFAVMEGVIETDNWFGPLFTNIMLRKPDVPIVIRSLQPLLQVQPVPKEVLHGMGKNSLQVNEGLESLGPREHGLFQDTVVRRITTRTRLGEYASEVRKGAKNS